jgi:colanic acid/amylovoran biosynthesis glycosyltransferase
MTPRRLLMVTSLYPYGTGEAFVAAELEHLAHAFGDIQLVPIFYEPGTAARKVGQRVNLAYADARWGMLRLLRVAGALLAALARYRWAADFGAILKRPRKLDNLKELVRALYRARMFERFLADQARKGEGVDLIYYYWLLPEIQGALAYRKASGRQLAVVCRAHGGDLYAYLKPGGYAGLRRSIVSGIDAIYTISDDGLHYLGQQFPALAGKFHTARLGVGDPGFLNPQPAGGALSLVSCSFVLPGKRLHLIVDAIAHLLAADPALEVRWTHVGDGPLLETIRARAAAAFGTRGVAVFKGYLKQSELMAVYRDDAFDAIINVSDTEGIPVSLMEAGAAGIPMIATDVGGTAEIVNAANGVLIPADADIATIAAAILRFRDRATVRACRKSARLHWEAHFNAAANYGRFARTLVAVAAAAAAAGPRADAGPGPGPDGAGQAAAAVDADPAAG